MKDFKPLFKDDVPLIDVRSPVEFEAGHFPASVNLPLMNNEERRLVGIRYKETGQAAAIALGHELVNEKIKTERVNHWLDFIRTHPRAKLYCFRGGLRSEISVKWIEERGVKIERISGGYKALRHFLIETIATESKNRKFLILGGRTGSGKTSLIKAAQGSFLDLEKYANHRGSSFGKLSDQPAQVTFENRIAVDLIKTEGTPYTLIEDESITIGSAIVPKILFEAMARSSLIVLERSMEERVAHIIKDYVLDKADNRAFMLQALSRIQKKLGGLTYSMILKQMNEAFQSPDVNSILAHRPWVETLLTCYYDRFYDRALERNASRIVFRGNETACIQYLRSNQ